MTAWAFILWVPTVWPAESLIAQLCVLRWVLPSVGLNLATGPLCCSVTEIFVSPQSLFLYLVMNTSRWAAFPKPWPSNLPSTDIPCLTPKGIWVDTSDPMVLPWEDCQVRQQDPAIGSPSFGNLMEAIPNWTPNWIEKHLNAPSLNFQQLVRDSLESNPDFTTY